MTIVNDKARVINKLEASLNDDARVVIYDRHMFIAQATESMDNDIQSAFLHRNCKTFFPQYFHQ
jgi:hypothetical protein